MNFGKDRLELIYDRLCAIEDGLARLEATIQAFARHQIVQAAYSTEQFAQLVGKAEYTVREWCRLGRIKADKRPCGRGNSPEWSIPHAELERYRSHGLLPITNNGA